MKLLKIIFLAVVSSLLFVSCVEKTGPEGTLGNYSVTCDKTDSVNTGSGIIFTKMSDAVVNLKLEFRTAANDKTVIATTDKVANEYKNPASEKIVVSVVFTEAKALGESEKKPVVLKTYTFTPVD